MYWFLLWISYKISTLHKIVARIKIGNINTRCSDSQAAQRKAMAKKDWLLPQSYSLPHEPMPMCSSVSISVGEFWTACSMEFLDLCQSLFCYKSMERKRVGNGGKEDEICWKLSFLLSPTDPQFLHQHVPLLLCLCPSCLQTITAMLVYLLWYMPIPMIGGFQCQVSKSKEIISQVRSQQRKVPFPVANSTCTWSLQHLKNDLRLGYHALREICHDSLLKCVQPESAAYLSLFKLLLLPVHVNACTSNSSCMLVLPCQSCTLHHCPHSPPSSSPLFFMVFVKCWAGKIWRLRTEPTSPLTASFLPSHFTRSGRGGEEEAQEKELPWWLQWFLRCWWHL